MVLVERTELQDLETRVHRGPRTDRDFAVRLAYVVGARPNIVKMAPVLRALRRRLPLAGHVVIHTGQHYDRLMSEVFLDDLGVTGPDQFLGVGSGSHSEQTARAMQRLESVLRQESPGLVIVSGDVNSTLAAALTAAQLGIPLAHVECGLRSFDPSGALPGPPAHPPGARRPRLRARHSAARAARLRGFLSLESDAA